MINIRLCTPGHLFNKSSKLGDEEEGRQGGRVISFSIIFYSIFVSWLLELMCFWGDGWGVDLQVVVLVCVLIYMLI